MKVVPLSKVKTNLSRYGRLCRKEPVVVTVNGVPAFELIPLDEDEDLIDKLLQYHPSFARQMASRLRERDIPVAEARRRL